MVVVCVAVGVALLSLALLDYAAYSRFVISWVWR